MLKVGLVVSTMFMAACAPDGPTKSVYINASGDSSLTIEAGKIRIGPSEGLVADEGLDREYIEWSEVMNDCSDAAYACVEFGSYAFVAPKRAVSQGETLRVRDRRFVIQSCDDDCNEFQARAFCDEADNCSSRTGQRITDYGYTYSRTSGIVAVQLYPYGPSTEQNRSAFRLSSGPGLLARE